MAKKYSSAEKSAYYSEIGYAGRNRVKDTLTENEGVYEKFTKNPPKAGGEKVREGKKKRGKTEVLPRLVLLREFESRTP